MTGLCKLARGEVIEDAKFDDRMDVDDPGQRIDKAPESASGGGKAKKKKGKK